MGSPPKCFIAYASTPQARAETIESAIDLIRHTGVVEIEGWKSLFPGGRPIIGRIFDAIRECNCFIADLTGLNPNVLFELGYAVAHRKRVWILLDTAIEKAKVDFDRLQLFTTVGYHGSSNGQKIVEAFFGEQPFADNTNLCDDLIDHTKRPGRPTLLYLMSQVDTEASRRLSRKVAAADIALIADDPAEGANQPLSWYINRAALEAYLRDIADSDRSLSRQITELLELIRQYGPDAVAGAIDKAATARAFGADYVANILRQQQCPRREQPPLRLRDPRLNELVTDPLSLLAYDAFILESEKESDDTPGTETPRSESDGHEPPSGDDPL